MVRHIQITDASLRSLIRKKEICFAGNDKLKIYGKLSCRPGKRMKKENRVFFESMEHALEHGFRPCAHCMKADYDKWKIWTCLTAER